MRAGASLESLASVPFPVFALSPPAATWPEIVKLGWRDAPRGWQPAPDGSPERLRHVSIRQQLRRAETIAAIVTESAAIDAGTYVNPVDSAVQGLAGVLLSRAMEEIDLSQLSGEALDARVGDAASQAEQHAATGIVSSLEMRVEGFSEKFVVVSSAGGSSCAAAVIGGTRVRLTFDAASLAGLSLVSAQTAGPEWFQP